MFSDCETKFEHINLDNKHILKIDNKIILEEIEKVRNFLFEDIIENNKTNNIIENELKQFKEFSKDKKNLKNKYQEWKNDWKQKINKFFIDNKKKINKYIILDSSEIVGNNNNKLDDNYNYYFLNYEYRYKDEIYQVNLYEIMSYKNSNNLKLVFKNELQEKDRIENYYSLEDKGLIIYKNNNF